MRTAPERRFLVFDGIAWVLATGIGLAFTRTWLSLRSELGIDSEAWTVGFWLAGSLPCLAMWTVALLLRGLFSSQPPRRNRIFQPGIMACAVVTFSIGIERVVCPLLMLAIAPERNRELVIYAALNGIPEYLGFAVAAAWIILGFCGRWHAEPNWIDRLGRFLGAAWIGVALISCFPSFQAYSSVMELAK